MEKMTFYEKQPKMVAGGNKVLVLLNERVEVEKYGGMDGEGEMLERNSYSYDGYWIDMAPVGDDVLAAAKEQVLSEIGVYDNSPAVNSFVLNGTSVWLDKATRVGLMNSTSIAKAMGSETTTLWLGEVKLEVECDKAIQLLSALEMYALECFNVTASHRKAVSEMTKIDKVLEYDYTAGYPSKLTMDI